MQRTISFIINLFNYILWKPWFKYFEFGARVSIFAKIKGKRYIKLYKGSIIYSNVMINCLDNDNKQIKLVLGKGSKIREYCLIEPEKGFIKIGESSSINQFCRLHGNITMGSYSRIATGSVIVAENHNYNDTTKYIICQGIEIGKIVIEDDVWIGANCNVLNNVSIRSGSIVGIGSVVTKDIEQFSIVAGNPSKIIKKR